MIAGRYVVVGTGRAVVMEVQAPLPGADYSARSSRVLRGPFLVVAVVVAPGDVGNAGAEVTVGAVSGGTEAFEAPAVSGVRFMQRMPTINAAGEPVVGDPRQFSEVTYLWPWYVHERDDALTLWVGSGGGAARSGYAVCSVWDLAPAEPGGAAWDAWAALSARLAEWRALVERTLVRY